jgi:hypothetical protein
LEEKNITLAIASDVADLLRKQGVDVIMTREGDNYVDLGKRVETANDNNAEVFVSIHNNASTIPMVGGGAWVYTYTPDGTTLSAQRGARYHLAQLLQNNLTPLPQLPAGCAKGTLRCGIPGRQPAWWKSHFISSPNYPLPGCHGYGQGHRGVANRLVDRLLHTGVSVDVT